MEEHQRNHIQRYLPQLIADTRCNALLLAHLIGNKVLDVDEVDEIDCTPTPGQKATLLYRIVQTRTNGYAHLLSALQATNQTGAVALLTLPERAKRKIDDFTEKYASKRLKQHLENFKFGVKDPSHLFTGRCEELDKLHEIFLENSEDTHRITVITQTISISGLGGIGKTQLARKYVHSRSAHFDGNVIWMNAETEETLTERFRILAKDRLEISTKDANGTEKDIVSVVSDVYDTFQDCRVLFVFDNAEKETYMAKFLPSRLSERSSLFILLTSRDTEWDVESAHLIRLGEMKEEDAVQFVRKGLKMDTGDDDLIRSLVVSLQCFPLAIQQAIAYINEENKRDDYSIGDYLDEFTTSQKDFLDSSVGTLHNDYQKTTFTTWKITLAKISTEPKVGSFAANLLNCIAYLSAENIERSMLMGMLPGISERNLKLAVSLLVRYSMVNGERKQSLLSVHRLVQQVSRTELSSTGEEETVLTRVLEGLEKENIDEKIRHVNHALSAWSYAYRSKCLVENFFMFPQGILLALSNTGGRNTEAVAFGTGEMGSKLLEILFPLIHQSRMWLDYRLCCALYDQGEYDSSLERLVDLLERCDLSTDPTSGLSLLCRGLHAELYRSQGNVERALDLHLELENFINCACDSSGGTSCLWQMERFAQSMEWIALCYLSLRKYGEALEYCKHSLDLQVSLFGEESERRLRVLFSMAKVKVEIGNYSSAMEIFQEISLKTSHVGLRLDALHKLAFYHMQMGNYEDAREACERALAGNIKIYGEHHPDMMTALDLKGFIMLCAGSEQDVEEALEIIAKTYNGFCKVLGENHETSLEAKGEIALAMYCKEQSEESLFAIEERIRYLTEKFGKSDRQTIVMCLNFAVILEKIGDSKKCVEVLEELRTAIITEFGSDHSLLYRIKGIIDRIEERQTWKEHLSVCK